MLIILQIVSIILFIWHYAVWVTSEVGQNENCVSASSIYFLCFALLYLFGG